MKDKNSHFIHNDGRSDYDVMILDNSNLWVLKEDYFEINGNIKFIDKAYPSGSKELQDLYDKIELNCLQGNLTSIGREIDFKTFKL